MTRKHGSKQQKKAAKQKAKRTEKRSELARRGSVDPTVRLQGVGQWPVVEARVSASLWESGLGQAVLARQEAPGRVVVGVFLIDVYCLGVKNAFWKAGTKGEVDGLIRRVEEVGELASVDPAYLVKAIEGAVAYALELGFRPHPDFRHASLLFEGIDPAGCAQEFTYGHEGKPYYVRGPYETLAQAAAICERIVAAGGDYVVPLKGDPAMEEGYDVDLDELEYDDDVDR